MAAPPSLANLSPYDPHQSGAVNPLRHEHDGAASKLFALLLLIRVAQSDFLHTWTGEGAGCQTKPLNPAVSGCTEDTDRVFAAERLSTEKAPKNSLHLEFT